MSCSEGHDEGTVIRKQEVLLLERDIIDIGFQQQ